MSVLAIIFFFLSNENQDYKNYPDGLDVPHPPTPPTARGLVLPVLPCLLPRDSSAPSLLEASPVQKLLSAPVDLFRSPALDFLSFSNFSLPCPKPLLVRFPSSSDNLRLPCLPNHVHPARDLFSWLLCSFCVLPFPFLKTFLIPFPDMVIVFKPLGSFSPPSPPSPLGELIRPSLL